MNIVVDKIDQGVWLQSAVVSKSHLKIIWFLVQGTGLGIIPEKESFFSASPMNRAHIDFIKQGS